MGLDKSFLLTNPIFICANGNKCWTRYFPKTISLSLYLETFILFHLQRTGISDNFFFFTDIISSPQSSRNHFTLTQPCTPKTSQMRLQNPTLPTHKCRGLKIKVLCKISISKTSHRNMFAWHLQRKQSSFISFIFFHLFIRSFNSLLLKNTPKLCLWETEISTTSGLPFLYLHFPFFLVRGKFYIGKKPDANQLVGTSEFTPNQWLEEMSKERLLFPGKTMLLPLSRPALRSSNWKTCIFYLNVLLSKAI